MTPMALVPPLKVSFIIPAHNEERWIGGCLSSIVTAAKHMKELCEIIVVDDSSIDQTADIASKFGVSVVSVKHRQISATRNSGAKAASGDILVFIDADTLITETIVKQILAAIRNGAIGGGCVPRFEGRLPIWFRAFYPVLVGAMRWIFHQTGGACLFCSKNGFDQTGGFSEAHFAAEEDVWIRALKRYGRFVVLTEPVVTSGRSLRTYSFKNVAWVFLRWTFRGADGFRSRDNAKLWYPSQRE